MQRVPEPDPDAEGLYRDHEFKGVKMLKLATGLYRILYEGEHKGVELYYDVDERRYFFPEKGVGKDGRVWYGPDPDKPFDMSAVSATRELLPEYAAGDIGIGVGYTTKPTLLYTSGLLSCVGWLLSNERGAYLTHIVVTDPAKVSPAGIKEQAQALYGTFVQTVGGGPATLTMAIDKDRTEYPDPATSWLQHLVPAGATVRYVRVPGRIEHFVHPVQGEAPQTPKIWQGPKISLQYV